jgi:MFS family permease
MASVIGSLALLPLIFVKEPKTKRTRKSLFKGISSLSKRLKYFIVVSTIFTLGNFGLYMFLILRAKEISGNFVAPLAMYALFSLTYAGFSIPFGKLSDKIGRKKVLFMGYSLFLIMVVGFIFVTNVWIFAVLFGVYGLVYAITQVNQRALVADLSPDLKGTSIGFYYFLTGLITIPAGIIAGALWNINYTTMFIYISAVGLVSLILLGFVKEKR